MTVPFMGIYSFITFKYITQSSSSFHVAGNFPNLPNLKNLPFVYQDIYTHTHIYLYKYASGRKLNRYYPKKSTRFCSFWYFKEGPIIISAVTVKAKSL